MKTIYHVYDEGPQGEIEGMFDEHGELLGCWSNNDATWRDEYFKTFMGKLGIEVKDGGKNKNWVKKLRRAFSC